MWKNLHPGACGTVVTCVAWMTLPDAMNQALKLDRGIRLLREMTGPRRPGRADRLR